jgi:hypothetical protein
VGVKLLSQKKKNKTIADLKKPKLTAAAFKKNFFARDFKKFNFKKGTFEMQNTVNL